MPERTVMKLQLLGRSQPRERLIRALKRRRILDGELEHGLIIWAIIGMTHQINSCLNINSHDKLYDR